MDVRPLLAILALCLVFWMIRTWFYWDSQAQTARRSRENLRRKISDVPLVDRVRAGQVHETEQNIAELAVAASPHDEVGRDIRRNGQAVNDTAASQIKMLEEQITERDQQIQRQEHAFEEIDKLKKTLFDRNRQIELLRQSSTKNDNALEQYRDKAQRSAMLEQQLSEANRLVEERGLEIDQLRQGGTGVHAHSTESNASNQQQDQVTLERLRKALAESEAAAKAAHQSDLELRRLRGELNTLQSRNVLSTTRISDLEKRIIERQHSMARARSEEDGSTGEFEHLKRKLHEKECQNDLLQQQIDSWKKRQAAPSAKADGPRREPLFKAPPEKDDLKLIKGIGPVLERTLNELGVTTFKQLAGFSQDEIDRVSAAINAFPGRIERDDWVGKAQLLYRSMYGQNV